MKEILKNTDPVDLGFFTVFFLFGIVLTLLGLQFTVSQTAVPLIWGTGLLVGCIAKIIKLLCSVEEKP